MQEFKLLLDYPVLWCENNLLLLLEKWLISRVFWKEDPTVLVLCIVLRAVNWGVKKLSSSAIA